MKNTFLISVLTSFFFAVTAQAGLLMTYHQLTLKDLDEMTELVSAKIKESKKSSSGKIIPLREAMQAVFSRPNEDGMIIKVYSPLKTQLDRLDSLEKVYRDLTDEALHALRNNKNFKADVQVTYAIFLENLISEFKPLASEPGFERKTLEKIASASVELTKEALKERKRRLMKEGESPSVLATLALKQLDEKKAELKAEPKTDDARVEKPAAKAPVKTEVKTDANPADKKSESDNNEFDFDEEKQK